MKLSNALRSWVVAACLAGLSGGQATLLADDASDNPFDPAHVEFFEKKVRPLLAARCHECHGSDKSEGNLRLDSRAGVLAGGDTGPAVEPGKPQESLLVDAVRYGDTYQMPPKSQLPPEEIATLVQWVRLGAPWGREAEPVAGQGSAPGEVDPLARTESHWCFQPIQDVEPPEVTDPNWIKTPVDRFVLARLEAAGLHPAPPAGKAALLRRVTYDLIGLPPTPARIDQFVADDSRDAYEEVVDRLLASPRYGERWARHWLDLVRYAETYGHEFDYDMPNAYRYRDYVIRALNDDLPYDRFVLEHVAGDLLPVPRRRPQDGANESIIATGSFLFGEAKHSPVDVRQDEADRIDNQIDVFAKTFLGLTVGCARCHDHKFDPITTEDYYALAGYLQSSRYQQAFLDPPEALADTIASLAQLRDSRQTACIEFARATMAERTARLAEMLTGKVAGRAAEAWDKYMNETARTRIDDPLHAWALLAQPPTDESPDSFTARRARLSATLNEQLANNSSDTTNEPIAFADFGGSDCGDWVATGAAFGSPPATPFTWSFASAGGQRSERLLVTSAAHSGQISAKLQGVLRSPTFEITRPKIFYRLSGTGGKVRLILDGLQLIQNPIYGGLQFDHGEAQPHWHAQDVSKWIGHRAYIEVVDDGDGTIALAQVVFSDGPAPTPKPNRIVAALLNDTSIDSLTVLADKVQALIGQMLGDWLAHPAGKHAADRAAIVNWFFEQRWLDGETQPAQLAKLKQRLAAIDEHRQQLESQIAPPRQALALADGTAENERVFIRGNPKTLGDEVPRRLLEVLGGTQFAPPDRGSGRLELARQLVAPGNPLVSRVIVNRLWHHHFGAGIVRTVDDFGVMGQPPTHPKLLDHLAAELMREGWSLKHIHRLIVLSNTYRMSSRAQPEADRVDPLNNLWHRTQVRRLEAEAIRDAMLAVSGRLDLKMYGPSVMPYLTPYMTGRGRPKESGPPDGDGRRTIYLAVRRNFLSPMLQAFDYPTPFTTIGRRGDSNVPAQALTMMNNQFVVEQARRWAGRALARHEQAPADRVREMVLTAIGRAPDDAELQAGLDFVGEPAELELDAWSDFAHVLLNLKEFIFIP